MSLDQVVFVVEGEKIIEDRIRNFSGYIDETTTPYGIGPRFHLRDNELWNWGHAGNHPRLVRKYESEEEAQQALEATFEYDFWASDIVAFKSREDAQQFLNDFLGEAQ